MHAAFALDELIRRHVPTLGYGVAHAFLVEGEHLGDRVVKPLDRMHTRLLHAVMGMPVPIESGRVLIDPLCDCLEVRESFSGSFHSTQRAFPP